LLSNREFLAENIVNSKWLQLMRLGSKGQRLDRSGFLGSIGFRVFRFPALSYCSETRYSANLAAARNGIEGVGPRTMTATVPVHGEELIPTSRSEKF
jgi:hypothetical protein